MTTPDLPAATAGERIVATEAAREAIARLRAAKGGVMFVVSGGCCDGSAPMCFLAGDFRIGSGDLLLGEIDGSPVYIDSSQDDVWGRPSFVLDVEPGSPDGFSLAAGDNLHFVLHS